MHVSLPGDETASLAVLRRCEMFDISLEAVLDDLACLAASSCGTSIAWITLIDADQQCFKAMAGLDASEMPRSSGISALVMLQSDLVIVPDTFDDIRFANDPLVTSEPRIRFYAGVPLISPEGQALGTLCVADSVPRQLSEDQIEALRMLARQAATQLELCRILAQQKQVEEPLRESEKRFRLLVEEIKDYAIFMLDPDGRVVSWNEGAERIKGYRAEEIMGRHFSCFYTPEDVAHGKPEQVLQVAAQVGRVEDEAWRVRKDGSRFWANVIITALHDQAGQFRGFAKVTRDITERKWAEERQRFLVEASTLLAASLDYETTLQNVAQLAVAYLADWCAIDILAEDGSIQRLAVAHADPAKVELARQLQQRYPLDPQAPHGVPQVLRTSQSELYPEISDEELSATVQDVEHLEILRSLGLRSAMVVPLLAHGQSLGAITFVTAESGRRYNTADLALAEGLAHHAALAVDNARLYYAAQQEIIERKQAEEALRARERQQAAVAELGQHALAGADLTMLMDEVVRHVAEILKVEYCKVLELLPDGKTLLLRAGVGWQDGLVGNATVGAGADSQAGYTLLSNAPVIVDDLHTETRFSGPALLHDHKVVSGMSVIIYGQDRPFGVLGVHTTRRRTFTRDDTNFLRAVAHVLATAIERKRAEEQLRRHALYDYLTGVANRALLMDHLGHAIERAKRHAEYRFGVLFIDLDCFKGVNDSLGHVMGDQLLVAAAQRLQAHVRAGDTVARLGGDEFAILLDDVGEVSNAIHVADRIQKAFGELFELSGHKLSTTVSIGITVNTIRYSRPEDILRHADIAMYRAKTLGKGRYQVFEPAMQASAPPSDASQPKSSAASLLERS